MKHESQIVPLTTLLYIKEAPLFTYVNQKEWKNKKLKNGNS